MNFKYKLMILVAGILALTSSLLTALGMSELFQGLFVIFLIIDLGRFLVLNFIVDEWKNLRTIKWVITFILSLLFIYSAIGVYNKLNSMIPASIQTAMIEAAAYNKAQDNAEIKQERSTDLTAIAQAEYQKSMDWNSKDYENCIKRASGDVNLENKCNNTKRRLDQNASAALKEAMKTANLDLEATQSAVDKNTKNQSEIAGVLTTVCKILPNTDCKTYDGLQMALTIIILLVICGLDYLQLSIVLAVNTRRNKTEEATTPATPIPVIPIAENTVEMVEFPIQKIPKRKRTKITKSKKTKQKQVVIETPEITESIQKPEIQVPTESESGISTHKKAAPSFTQKTDFYK